MPNETHTLEALKVRHDLFKQISIASLAIATGFVVFYRSVADNYEGYAFDNFWTASKIVLPFLIAFILSIIGSELVARSMEGTEPRGPFWIKWIIVSTTLFFAAGFMLMWYYSIGYLALPKRH